MRCLRVVALVTALFAADVAADWQSRSWSRWELDAEGAEVVAGIDRVELQRLGLPDDAQAFQAELGRGVRLSAGGVPCVLLATEPRAAPSALLVARMRFRCQGGVVAPTIRVRLLDGVAVQPLHYATIQYQGRASEALLTHADDAFSPPVAGQSPAIPAVLAEYIRLGFVHILEGLDHVAFLLCLLLAVRGLRRRVWMVTGFTLGHSLTLSLSALGFVRVQTAGVEALIGFSVALLAAEVWQRGNGGRVAAALLCGVSGVLLAASVAGRPTMLPTLACVALLALAPAYLALASRMRDSDRLHAAITAVFGLVHGLGFASALESIGLPEGRRGWALAGFNLGVELGQLVLLCMFAVLIAALSRWMREALVARATLALSGLLFATGMLWLVERGA